MSFSYFAFMALSGASMLYALDSIVKRIEGETK